MVKVGVNQTCVGFRVVLVADSYYDKGNGAAQHR
jgi:hypothetical protein